MKSRPILVLLAFILLASTCKKRNFERDHLLVESSFEGSNPFSEWTNNQHCCDYSLTQNTDKYTDGTHSMRVDVRSTDPLTSSGIRSELVQPVDKPGTERWYGFNIFLENWADDNAGESIFQWHPNNSTGVGTASLWASGGRFVFQRDPSGSNTASEYIDIGPVISNQWVSWVIHVKWADDNTGLLQVWKNGSLMIDKANIKTAPTEGTYFKLGIYKFGWLTQVFATTERVLYYDEVRIGDENANYDDVKPGN
ncbi:MAG: polysaccharide lyase [Bacteroidota bacterium]|nr:polysaccharide lyase [Bacteroidota bacterium]